LWVAIVRPRAIGESGSRSAVTSADRVVDDTAAAGGSEPALSMRIQQRIRGTGADAHASLIGDAPHC
jgi:hypothetical protein